MKQSVPQKRAKMYLRLISIGEDYMEQLSFEEAFAQLEAAVAALQDGQLPLEQALQRYQDGMKLAQHCNELLQKAELTIQQLNTDSTSTLSVEPFEY
jgi:exodeoxyribonuclease VII small subunit